MKTRTIRILAAILIIILGATALMIVRSHLLNSLKSGLQQKIEALNQTDFNIKYDSIHIDWRKNLIVIDALVIEKDAYDTTCLYPEFVSAGQVRIEGFSLLTFLLKKTLSFETVNISSPHIVLRQQSKLLLDSTSQKQNEFSMHIDKLQITSAHLEYTDSASCKLISEFKTNIRTTDLQLDFAARKPLLVSMGVLSLDSTKLNLPNAFYTFLIKETNVNFATGTLNVDTLRIIPHYPKLTFGRKKGHETDRVEGVVPFVKLTGLKLQYIDTLIFEAGNTDIQMYLKIFRDKRLADHDVFKPLPIQQLQKLPFGLSLDTLRLIKSYVEYEEFAEDTDHAITVYFDDLAASIYNVNNDSKREDGETIVKARAKFMGEGELQLTTALPWKKGQNYHMKGSLKNFKFAKMNPVLEPIANMQVESGILEDLSFQFNYDLDNSKGEVELNYHDLKLVSFKDDEKLKKAEERNKRRKNSRDPEDLRKDNLKTFIINAFIIRKNMDKNVPEDKRTGTVSFNRNPARSVFNYWWKSLFSGIKSAYNLDKFQPKDPKSNERKEEKKSRKKRKTNKDKKEDSDIAI